MRKTISTYFIIALLVLLGIDVVAQGQKKALTNADVIAMHMASLPENTMLLAIQQGPTEFDTSAQKLIELKNQGVSPRILDAMIQAGTAPEPKTQTSSSHDALRGNPLSPIPNATDSVSYGDVLMVDGAKRSVMTRSQVNGRTGGFMMQAVNPFKKSKVQGAINGNHSQLRTTNTSPLFEVGISSDLNPSDYVTLVKLKAKSDRREIELSRASITGGISSGFRKEDMIPVTLEELPGSAGNKRLKSYRIKTVTPIPPGEYALAVGGSLLYDFGIDTSK